MVGLGKWEFSVKTMFYSGKIFLDIFDDGGKYGYKLEVPGMKVPNVDLKEVNENGNTVEAVLQTSLLQGKDLLVHAEFDGDTVDGYIRIPFLGKVKIQNGKKIG